MVRSVTLLTIIVTLSLERPHSSCKDARPEALAGTKSPPSPCTTHAQQIHETWEGKETEKKRKKQKKKGAGRWDSKLRWERGDPEERWDRQIKFWLCLSSWGTYIKLQLVLVSDVNRSCGQLDELNFPVWWFILKLILYCIHQVHVSDWGGIYNVHDSPLEFLAFLIPNRAGLQEMILIVDNRPTIMFLIQLMKYWILK